MANASTTNLPPATVLLADLLNQLPKKPMVLQGQLKVAKGMRARSLNISMDINWGSDPSLVSYTLRDNQNKDLEQLTVIRRGKRDPKYKYAKGDPLVTQNVPDLFAPVQGTDLSWAEISLMFLWWKGAKTVGVETIRSRPCYIVETPSPDRMKKTYGRTRIWIDQSYKMLLQAESYDSKGKLVRRMTIKSFKKIDDQWMIKDIDIQSFPANYRTRLRIHSVEEVRERDF